MEIGIYPWINAIVKKNKFAGLETLGYGTSGEFAIKRSLANKIEIGTGYRIETHLNTQVYHMTYGNLNKLAQVDFGIFEHLSSDINEDRKMGKDEAMQNMAKEISETWVKAALETGLELSVDEFYQIYLAEVAPTIKLIQKIVERSKIARKAGIKYGPEQIKLDMKRLEQYKSHIKEGIKNAIKEHFRQKKRNILPSWRFVIESTGVKIYEDLKEHLSKATAIYTLKRLEELELI